MGYKKNIFNDKTIIAASAIGVLAIAAIAGGVFLGMSSDDDNTGNIVDLDQNASSGYYEEMESDDYNQIAERDNEENTDNQADIEGNENDTEEPSSQQEEQVAYEEESTEPIDVADEDALGEEVEDVNISEGIVGLNFSPSSVLVWPVEGNVLIEFDMDNTVYFATLDLYKCSDAVCIQSAVDTPVYAASTCSIEEIGYNSEIGNNVTVSLGNGYMLTYGQLKDVQVATGDVLEEGDLIGYVGNPTKYYTVEGPNLYMKMTKEGQAVDPLDYLNYE